QGRAKVAKEASKVSSSGRRCSLPSLSSHDLSGPAREHLTNACDQRLWSLAVRVSLRDCHECRPELVTILPLLKRHVAAFWPLDRRRARSVRLLRLIAGCGLGHDMPIARR